MSRKGIPLFAAGSLILGSALLLFPVVAFAQHHGGYGMGGGIPGASGRPSGVDEKDSLKDFHQAMAVQASSSQVSAFQAMVKSTQTAQEEVQGFLQPVQNGGTVEPTRRDPLDQALQNARTWNRTFQEGFSPAQKSGLKEISKKLAKIDSDLEQDQRKLDQSLDAKAPASELAAHAGSLDKLLTDLYNQQLALGREMSIVLASGQDVAFTLLQVRRPVSIDNRTIAVTVSGALSQIAAQAGQRTFRLDLVADLSDLQENMTDLLRAQLDTSAVCGQRVAIKRATLAPSTPASVLVVQLHFERWTCTRSFGQQTPNELAEGDGSVEIKLTANVEPSNPMKVAAVFSRIDATGMMAEELRSGSLGEDLRDKASRLVLAAAQAGSDFKISLPPAVQNSASVQGAKFQDAGVGGLSLALIGRVEISNDQADQLASQLNQALSQAPSAHGTPGTTPQLAKRPQ